MKKIGAISVFLILGMFSVNVTAIPLLCNGHCQDLGFSGGDCYAMTQCPTGTEHQGGHSTGQCIECEICCCDISTEPTTTSTTTSTTIPTTVPTTTTTTSSTTTTIPGAMEFSSLGITIAVLLVTPAFAYLIVKRKGA